MQINDLYKIESDDTNIILQRRKLKEDGTYTGYVNIGYHSTIQQALRWLVKKDIQGSGMKDLEEINKKIEELNSTILGLKFIDKSK